MEFKGKYRKFLLALLVMCFLPLRLFATDHTVTMKSLSFDPKRLDIKVGDSVQWQNKSLTEHFAKFEDGEIDTGMVVPQKSSKLIQFSKAGDYKYHCSVHGKTMSGSIVVSP